MTERRTKKRAGTSEHQNLVARVGIAVRKMCAQSVIASRTIADRFRLHTTDLEVLDLIYLREHASASELADATGLTSGSVTALIDRLVDAGHVERTDDPADRRKVLVRIRHETIEPIKAVYAVTQRQMVALWSTFAARDLEVIADFLTRSTELIVERCRSLQQEAAHARGGRRAARAGRRQETGVKLRSRPGERLAAAPSLPNRAPRKRAARQGEGVER
jgi:DNA-binding MarR family transcriptional regulator